jgi:hypothetical protein
MEFEKVCHPLSMMEKKKYIYNKYDDNPDKYKRVIMGYTLKRRDNAIIVHRVIGRAVEIAMDEQDPPKAVEFLKKSLYDILDGKYPITDFITTKTLKANYKGTKKITDSKGREGEPGTWFWDDVNCSIAHVKLCQRMKERDLGNCPQVNDRIAFVTVAHENSKKMLQADRIEHPDYIIANNLKIDYLFYISNQIMNPCIQFFELLTDELSDIFNSIIQKETKRNEMIFDKIARNAGLKKLEKYGIVENKDNLNDDWDPDAGFNKKSKSNLNVDDILMNYKIDQNITSRKKKIDKQKSKKDTTIKRNNKYIDMIVSEINERLDLEKISNPNNI